MADVRLQLTSAETDATNTAFAGTWMTTPEESIREALRSLKTRLDVARTDTAGLPKGKRFRDPSYKDAMTNLETMVTACADSDEFFARKLRDALGLMSCDDGPARAGWEIRDAISDLDRRIGDN